MTNLFKKECEIIVVGGEVTRVIDFLNELKIGSKLTFKNFNETGSKIINFRSGRKAYDQLMQKLKNGHVTTLYKTFDMFGRIIWQEL